MENTNPTPPTDQGIHDGSKDQSNMSGFRQRRYLLLPITLGIVLLVIFVLMAATFTSHHHSTVSASRSFGSNHSMMGMGRYGGTTNGVGISGMRRGGLIGAISKVDGNNLTIHTATADTVVTVDSTTSIYKAGVVAKQSDLATGQAVIVRGAPNASGQITANVIEIQ